VSRRVSAEAPEAGHPEEPGGDQYPHAAQVDRLGVEVEPIEPGLCAFEQLAPWCARGARAGAQKTNRMSKIRIRIAAPMLMYMVPPWIGLGPSTQMTPLRCNG
jgi:hypothetical protein